MTRPGIGCITGSFSDYDFHNTVNVGNVTSYTLAGVDLNATIAVTAYDAYATNLNDPNSTLANQPNGYES